ncbi:glycosyltransferase family 2 protein [Aquabacterium sp.]|uniref:glycosyltransferase family 2 protein n=1 Tax=Aquabacterium sp. TaxID=1872578 RepID=UPI003BB1EBE7
MSTPQEKERRVQILMSTFNGEKYLDEQIQSLADQAGVHVSILVRDDGSRDSTCSILHKWEQKGILKWYKGTNLGPARSFMELVFCAPPSDYYAFCDQDDVWDTNKLQVALEKLEELPKHKPCIYFSNARLVDANLNKIGSTNLNPEISLGSALIINPVIGCTAVFNKELLAIARNFDHQDLYMHDGWIYRICMAVGGAAVFDKTSHISYRQHSNNVVGGVRGTFYKRFVRRLKSATVNRRCTRLIDAKALLAGYSELIQEPDRAKILLVANYKKNIRSKLKLIISKEIKTNSTEHNISFVIAVLLGAF